ncbi:hypothetical protein FACS1894181_05530 [Bacteroidia bacterium]|nr:hypothetical protein FACS1894181_05530 [Bacteroidia bacterium]
MFSQDDSSESYAVQFHSADMDTLTDWMEREGEAIHRALSEKFGNKMLGFSTLLEEIELG